VNLSKREEVIKLLEAAQSKGIISNLDDVSMRKIAFVNGEGTNCHIEWYCNLGTLHIAGFSLWFDRIELTESHPCYLNEIGFSYEGARCGFIGKLLPHLQKSRNVNSQVLGR